jgi:uncharacterized membrane protein YgcG
MNTKSIAILFTAFMILIPRTYAAATERILSFTSHIEVLQDARITVRETITVQCENIKIKRGIYRDFPTIYTGTCGLRKTVGFRVISVLRDGKPEPFHISELNNGQRIYIGKEDVFLSKGVYSYTIVYSTDRQLKYFQEYDELYWNVTGTKWEFPIDRATAVVALPKKIPRSGISLKAYTGPEGSRNQDYTSSIEQKKISFTTTKPFDAYEGLTISVSWPKGYVYEPDERKKLTHLVSDNMEIGIGLGGLILLLLYYTVVWFIAGIDPKRGTIIPLFNPPENLSPAAVRYIQEMGYDIKAFAAALINMAVKGFISIKEDDSEYVIVREKTDDTVLSREEKKIAKKLFGSKDELTLSSSNNSTIRDGIRSIKNILKMSFEKIYFITNKGYFIPGFILSILIIVIGIYHAGRSGFQNFIGIWLTFWTIAVAFLISMVIKSWRNFFSGRKHKTVSLFAAIFLTLFSLPFIAAEFFVLFFFANISSLWFIAIMIALIVTDYLFYRLLKAPTRAGRRILDSIEGFKMFLSVAEKDRLQFGAPIDKTPEVFEKYLPYALALDVEQEWAEQFSEILQNAEITSSYSPSWYHGSLSSGLADFSTSLSSSLTNAISSSTTSSSGSGGGGFSGGGGGGGGGGGW